MSEKKVMTLSLACLAVIAVAFAAKAEEKRVWTLSGLSGTGPRLLALSYGVPETDDDLGGFQCKARSGVVTLFVSATSSRLRPGRKATAILSAGDATASIAGRLTPNEEAGVPSFEGKLAADSRVLAALAGGGTMTVGVGPSRQSAPLAGAEEKFRKFVAACARQ
ncbi:hypothetical protein [Methylocystis echinoides]|uniref:Invasion associated locus B family protein n=1 Tax=Methylocystis echinoides TaxID=29468 RepID=A0A9W6GXG9_9HYPH|nr:hypothetical protein [Methylocystis echinoides]GLI94620.1 hypothetical protein LMG27198_36120 [Methylocystis echinoides]